MHPIFLIFRYVSFRLCPLDQSELCNRRRSDFGSLFPEVGRWCSLRDSPAGQEEGIRSVCPAASSRAQKRPGVARSPHQIRREFSRTYTTTLGGWRRRPTFCRRYGLSNLISAVRKSKSAYMCASAIKSEIVSINCSVNYRCVIDKLL